MEFFILIMVSVSFGVGYVVGLQKGKEESIYDSGYLQAKYDLLLKRQEIKNGKNCGVVNQGVVPQD